MKSKVQNAMEHKMESDFITEMMEFMPKELENFSIIKE